MIYNKEYFCFFLSTEHLRLVSILWKHLKKYEKLNVYSDDKRRVEKVLQTSCLDWGHQVLPSRLSESSVQGCHSERIKRNASFLKNCLLPWKVPWKCPASFDTLLPTVDPWPNWAKFVREKHNSFSSKNVS